MSRTALELIGQSGLGYSFDSLAEDTLPHPFNLAVKRFSWVNSTVLRLSPITWLEPPSSKSWLSEITFFRQLARSEHPVLDGSCWRLSLGKPFKNSKRYRIWCTRHLWKFLNQRSKLYWRVMKQSQSKLPKERISWASSVRLPFSVSCRSQLIWHQCAQIWKWKRKTSYLTKFSSHRCREWRCYVVINYQVFNRPLRTLTFAAMETTASAVTRCLECLAQHQEVQDRLRLEIRQEKLKQGNHLSYDDLVNLPYLDAICRETLRLSAVPILCKIHQLTRK